MKFLNSKAILVAGVILLGGGATLLWATNNPIILTTDLDNPKQYIQKTVVVVPDNEGRWNGGTTITVTGGAISIEGSIIGNNNENVISIEPCCTTTGKYDSSCTTEQYLLCPLDQLCCGIPSNSNNPSGVALCTFCRSNNLTGDWPCPSNGNTHNLSILGGQENKMGGHIKESTIGGGVGNEILGSISFIGGGKENKIKEGTRNTILGGIKNTIGSGDDNVILGGAEHSITGNFSTIIGSHNNKINGNSSFAAGSGTHIGARDISTNGTFARNDGSKIFTVTQSNIFAINATNGVVVGRERPHPGAALSLSRAIRIQPSARDATGCTAALAGTMKSVKISGSNGEKLCLCACADNAWQSLGNDNYLCPSICAGTTPPITDDPQCNDGVLGGCTVGSIVSVPTSQDGMNGENHSTTWYWHCTENNKTSPTCGITFTCLETPQHAQACPGSLSGIDITTNSVVQDACRRDGVRNPKCEWICKPGFEFDNGECEDSPLIDGECGTANGQTMNIAPSGNSLCSRGTPTSVVDNGLLGLPTWTWQCGGKNGGSDSQLCTTYKSPTCGNGHNTVTSTQPPLADLCAVGLANSLPNAGGKWNWICSNGSETVPCYAYETPVCGSASDGNISEEIADDLGDEVTTNLLNEIDFSDEAIVNLLDKILVPDGTSADPKPGTDFNTSPEPNNPSIIGGHPDTMRELKKKLKEAGLREIPENETLLETLLSEVLQMVQLSDTQPTTNLCAVGQPLGMRETILGWTWYCTNPVGQNGIGCFKNNISSPTVINGVCGSAAVGQTAKPSGNTLCAAGTATTVSPVNGPGPRTWTCQGTGGGISVDCTAPLKINGVCGNASCKQLNTAPTGIFCSAGQQTSSPVNGDGRWTWICNGENGGSNASCNAYKKCKPGADCGSLNCRNYIPSASTNQYVCLVKNVYSEPYFGYNFITSKIPLAFDWKQLLGLTVYANVHGYVEGGTAGIHYTPGGAACSTRYNQLSCTGAGCDWVQVHTPEILGTCG